jgi:hypothetical protein
MKAAIKNYLNCAGYDIVVRHFVLPDGKNSKPMDAVSRVIGEFCGLT